MPSDVISIDFETRSREDISGGAYRYAEHPSTEILMVASARPGQAPDLWTYRDGGEPEALLDHVNEGGIVSAWNAEFELAIWNGPGRRRGWPPLSIDQVIDSKAQAAMCGLPQSLEKCAEALNLGQDKQKMAAGKRLIRRFSVPRRMAGAPFAQPEEFQDDWALFGDYCRQDVVVEMAISERLPKLPKTEQRLWTLTARINERGVPLDLDEIKAILRVTEAEIERLNAESEALTLGRVKTLTDVAGITQWVNRHGVATDSIAADRVAQLLAGELPPKARRLLELRQMAGKSSVAKYRAMQNSACADSRVRGMLAYHGAATGRYTSLGGVNLQNMARPPLKGDDINDVLATGEHTWAEALFGDQVMDAAVSALRGVVKTPAGRVLLDADFVGIENRVGPFLADDTETLEIFRQGLDQYKVFGAAMYKTRYEDVTKDQRQVAKSACLGCLFGQGAKGLQTYAEGFGVTLTQDEAGGIVDIYRSEYPKIASLWRKFDTALRRAMQNPGQTVKAGKRVRLRFDQEADFLQMRLPSGRSLYYYHPCVEPVTTSWGETKDTVVYTGVNSVTRQLSRISTYGARMFQNAVQGTARDLLVNSMFALEQAGYTIILTIHDEILCEVSDGVDLDHFMQIMSEVPAWAEGLPVDVDGWTGRRFRK